jgi:GTPase SAR1 family protein
MGKFAVVVVGPAGSGKSTFCKSLQEYYNLQGRSAHIFNLDPAAEDLQYEPSLDVRNLIQVDDVMEAQELGPNGGLVFCMQYLMEHIAWLHDAIEDYPDDFLIIDMPGQIELLSHIPVGPAIVEFLKREGYSVVAPFLLDACAVTPDSGKYVSGCLVALTTLMSLDCPFLGILSKVDILPADLRRPEALSVFEACDFGALSVANLPPRFRALTQRLAGVVEDFSLLRFMGLDMSDEDSIAGISGAIDDILQVAEDMEPRDRDLDNYEGSV